MNTLSACVIHFNIAFMSFFLACVRAAAPFATLGSGTSKSALFIPLLMVLRCITFSTFQSSEIALLSQNFWLFLLKQKIL